MGRAILPGKSERVEGTSLHGGASILATTNDRENKKVWLRGRVAKVLHAACYSGADWDPKWRWLDFGTVPHHAGPQTRTLTMRRGDGDPLALKIVSVEAKHWGSVVTVPLRASATLRVIEPGEHYELDVTIEPPWAEFWYTGVVGLETGVPEQPAIEVPFHARFPLRVRLAANGTPVPLSRSEPYEVTYRLTWSGDGPTGRITGVRSEVAAIQATLEERAGEQVVVVQVLPDCQPQPPPAFHYVQVFTDDPSMPEIRLRIRFESPPPQPG